ncbi:thermonuclease family protein [Hwanghaeella sp.]|uniref:thermonuclease family protein n=1 Tax=Hwanghaeella sp. TaxID=2605943 RepID=UPI003CCC2AAA
MRIVFPFRRPKRGFRLSPREGLMALAMFAAVFIANFAFDEQPRSTLAAVAGQLLPVSDSSIAGTVTHVRDGDTIEVEGVPIRLNGLSAPERGEPFGKASSDFMRALVLGKAVRCELNGERTHDRLVGVCYLDGADISALIIREGLARDCPRYSGGKYAADERQAKRRGLHDSYRLPSYCR